ncbi:MAG: right-handed parallel beta-helix repeat-containing protein [Thermoprotei archaeon]
MNRKFLFGILPMAFLILIVPILPFANAATCTPVSPSDTAFGTSLTAAVVASNGQTITTTVDATGCDVGVYIGPGTTGVIISATVHDANKVGIFNDGGNAVIEGSTIYNIGNHVNGVFSPNGVQTGIGIYFSASATGKIDGNNIYNYQKGGIVVRNLESVYVTNNTVTGLGPFKLIAQNGIELGFGTYGPTLSSSNVGHVTGNVVTGNIYTEGAGTKYVSTGILGNAIAGSNKGLLTAALEKSNTVFGNQVDVAVIIT